MTKAKLEELIADLGYALMHLKQAQAEGAGYNHVNRTRQLVAKVGDALIAENKKLPGKLKGRAYQDLRRLSVLDLCATQVAFLTRPLTTEAMSDLYAKVCNDNEDWDGEDVDVKHIVKLMIDQHIRSMT